MDDLEKTVASFCFCKMLFKIQTTASALESGVAQRCTDAITWLRRSPISGTRWLSNRLVDAIVSTNAVERELFPYIVSVKRSSEGQLCC